MKTQSPTREPEQIRQDCAARLRPVEISGMFAAWLDGDDLGYLLVAVPKLRTVEQEM